MFTNDCAARNLQSYFAGHLAPKPVPKTADRNRWGQRALAKTALLKRDFSQAKKYIDAVAQKAKDRKDQPAYARALNESAFIHILMNKLDAAAIIYRQVYEIWRGLRMERNSVGFNEYTFFLWDYGVFLRNSGEIALAQRIESKLERLTNGFPMTFVYFSRAERLADRGQFIMAEQFYEDAFDEAELHRDLNMQLKIADRLSPVYQLTGKSDIAESLVHQKATMNKVRYMSMFGRKTSGAITS